MCNRKSRADISDNKTSSSVITVSYSIPEPKLISTIDPEDGNWPACLKNHKDREEYRKEVAEVVKMINTKDSKIQVFLKLVEAQPLVVVTNSIIDGSAQYLVNF